MLESPDAFDDVVVDAASGPILRIRVQPRASRPGVRGAAAGELKVAVRSPADRGRATEEALRRIAEWLGLSRSGVELVSGGTSRSKRLRVAGRSAGGLRKMIRERLIEPER